MVTVKLSKENGMKTLVKIAIRILAMFAIIAAYVAITSMATRIGVPLR